MISVRRWRAPVPIATIHVPGVLSAGPVQGVVAAYRAFRMTGVYLSVGGAPADNSGSAGIIVDINKNFSTVFTTQANRPTIADGAVVGGPGVAPNVSAVAAGDVFSAEIDQVGPSTPGTDLTIVILGIPA